MAALLFVLRIYFKLSHYVAAAVVVVVVVVIAIYPLHHGGSFIVCRLFHQITLPLTSEYLCAV